MRIQFLRNVQFYVLVNVGLNGEIFVVVMVECFFLRLLSLYLRLLLGLDLMSGVFLLQSM